MGPDLGTETLEVVMLEGLFVESIYAILSFSSLCWISRYIYQRIPQPRFPYPLPLRFSSAGSSHGRSVSSATDWMGPLRVLAFGDSLTLYRPGDGV